MQIQTPQDLGNLVRSVRKALGLTQDQLALTSGTNRRFVVELERGKPTTRLAHVFRVLQTLGIAIALTPPSGTDLAAAADASGSGSGPKSGSLSSGSRRKKKADGPSA